MKLFGARIDVDLSEAKEKLARMQEAREDRAIVRMVEKEKKSLRKLALRQIQEEGHERALAAAKAELLAEMKKEDKAAQAAHEAKYGGCDHG